MAIQDSFNLSNAINSQSYAYKCWYNYNYGNNTMGISAKDMGEITQTWNNELKNWKATALNDENAYEIEDDDFSTAKLNGRDQAKEKTGFSGNTGGAKLRAGIDLASGVAGSLASTVGSKIANSLGTKVGNAVSAGFVQNAAAKAGAKAAEKATTGAAAAQTKAINNVQSAGKNVGFIITAPLALATGTAYQAKKPNKDEKEACDDLQDEMNNASAALGEAQSDMQSARDEVEALSDEAQIANEDANGEIEDKKSEYDVYRASYEALMAKVESGEPLTDDEKELLKELVPIMKQLGIDIADTQGETTDQVAELYEDMGTYQANYDDAATTVAEVQGLTDYAESFDDATRTMCYVEAGAQTLNAASGTKAALQAGKVAASGGIFTAWAWAFAGMGAAGAAMSGVGAAQQYQWAGEVGNEINLRKDAQELNVATNDIYDESIDIYQGQMDVVNDMEIAMPEDLSDPDAVASELDEGSAAALNGGNNNPAKTPTAENGNAEGTSGANKNGEDKDKDKNKKTV